MMCMAMAMLFRMPELRPVGLLRRRHVGVNKDLVQIAQYGNRQASESQNGKHEHIREVLLAHMGQHHRHSRENDDSYDLSGHESPEDSTLRILFADVRIIVCVADIPD